MPTQFSYSPLATVPLQRVEQDLAELSERAKAIHLSLNSVCRSAGVPPNLLTQWKSGSARVTGTTFGYHVGKVARQLEAEEAQMLAYLKQRAGRVHDGGRAKTPRAGPTASRARAVQDRIAG